MIKDLAEDLILIALLVLAAWAAWTFWLRDKYFATTEKYATDAKTVYQAATSPVETVKDLFRSTTPYISQEQFRANIETIKRNLAGKM